MTRFGFRDREGAPVRTEMRQPLPLLRSLTRILRPSTQLPVSRHLATMADQQTGIFLGDKLLAKAMTSDLEKVEGK